ncbi:MAG: TVP38/TMEM64 family protein [Blastocatellales bacterium]|nr:TVP38/TMEM64 family protein [Blastocatellales bacterium]
MDTANEGEQRRRSWWKPAVLVALLACVIVIARLLGAGDSIAGIRSWIESFGAWGPVVFTGIYIVGVVAALPGSALTLAAGALFGSVIGIVVVSIGATCGAGLAFLISRYLARDAVVAWLGRNEKFQKLDRMTEQHGAVIVALTRLVPLFPFNLLNYGFGLTRVSFRTYIFWSWLCMLPGAVLYVVGADALAKGIAEKTTPWTLIAAAVIAALVLALLVRAARRRLNERDAA